MATVKSPNETSTLTPAGAAAATRRVGGGLLDPHMLWKSLPDAVKKLDPRVQLKNPVMFVVEVGSMLTTYSAIIHSSAFSWLITVWLWLTVIFANLAEAVAEGRGKAQAETLRRAKQETVARRLVGWKPGDTSFRVDDVPGTAFISPLRTEVVLNLAHFSIDVTAHELVHAELAQRLGFWTRTVKLPVWFDEGVAVQLDRRAPYAIDCGAVGGQRIRAVRQLTTVRRFRHGDRGQIVRNYQAAKCAAAEVLERHPPGTLYASLARLAQGADFDDVFGPGPITP